MSAEQLLRDGDLAGCLSALQDQVRKDPANLSYRVFLFQLLAVIGEWRRALTQLDVVKDMDTSTWPMVQTYREAVQCEVLREEIFSGKHTPLVFGDPEQWVALMIEAIRLDAAGEHEKAKQLREEAFEQAPASTGKIDDVAFQWLADADSRLGPVIEAVINGKYYWVPVHQIKRIRIEPPEDLRDFVWTAAQFMWTNGGEAVGLIPSRYPGSTRSDDPAIRLARKTEWLEKQTNIFEGVGQRLLTTDVNDYALLDVREIHFDAPEGE